MYTLQYAACIYYSMLHVYTTVYTTLYSILHIYITVSTIVYMYTLQCTCIHYSMPHVYTTVCYTYTLQHATYILQSIIELFKLSMTNTTHGFTASTKTDNIIWWKPWVKV